MENTSPDVELDPTLYAYAMAENSEFIPETILPETRKILRDARGRVIWGIAQQTNKNGTAGRPPLDEKEKLQKLREAYLIGCDDLEACLYSDVSLSWLYGYQRKNPEFIKLKMVWRENPALEARKTILRGVLENDETAIKYMERKKKDEFSLRSELTGKDGEPLDVTLNRLEHASNYDELAQKAGTVIPGAPTPGETAGQVVAADASVQDKG